MTTNEIILSSMVAGLMATMALLALSSCVDASKAIQLDWHIAECEMKHGKPCEVYARVIE